MQLYLTDQQGNFEQHLQKLSLQPVMRYTRARLREQVSAGEAQLADVERLSEILTAKAAGEREDKSGG